MCTYILVSNYMWLRKRSGILVHGSPKFRSVEHSRCQRSQAGPTEASCSRGVCQGQPRFWLPSDSHGLRHIFVVIPTCIYIYIYGISAVADMYYYVCVPICIKLYVAAQEIRDSGTWLTEIPVPGA